MFRSEICDSSSKYLLNVLTEAESRKMIALFDKKLVNEEKYNNRLHRWDAFKNIIKKYEGNPEDHLPEALSSRNVKPTDILYLVHDEIVDKVITNSMYCSSPLTFDTLSPL